MLDYCLLMCLFQKTIQSYYTYGDYKFPSILSKIIESKNISKIADAELVVIYNEPKSVVDFFWRNKMTKDIKWLFVVAKNRTDGVRIYQEIKSFGDHFYLNCDQPIIIIKNIHPDFKNKFRDNMLNFNDNKTDLDEFMEIKSYAQENLIDNISINSKDKSIIQSLCNQKNSKNNYVYIGERISNQDMARNEIISKLGFCIIENYSIQKQQAIGYCVRYDIIEQFWIWESNKSDLLLDFFDLFSKTISIPLSYIK